MVNKNTFSSALLPELLTAAKSSPKDSTNSINKIHPFSKSKNSSKTLKLLKWTLLRIGFISTLTSSTRVGLHITLTPNSLNNKKKPSQVSWESQIPWSKDSKEFHKKKLWKLWVIHPTGLSNSVDKPFQFLWSVNSKANLLYTRACCWKIWYGQVLQLLDSRADGLIFTSGLDKESVKSILW